MTCSQLHNRCHRANCNRHYHKASPGNRPGASSTLGFTHHIDDNTAIAFGSIVENIRSGSGADDLFGNDVENAIYGGAGDDLLHGEDGNDTLLGEADHDTIYGGSGDDLISGDTGEDHLNDAWGDDSLSGEDGADTIIAHLGENTLSGGDADDFLCAGFGNDQLIGGSGDDLILADFPHRYARGNDISIRMPKTPNIIFVVLAENMAFASPLAEKLRNKIIKKLSLLAH